MSDGVTVDMSDLLRELERRGRTVRNLDELMPRLGAILQTHMDDYIQSEGAGSWPPFSPETLIRHPRRRGGMLLQDTGLLAQLQMDAGRDSVEVFSPAPYTKYHKSTRDITALDMDPVLAEMSETLQEELTR
jgi:phage gpG-like protein